MITVKPLREEALKAGFIALLPRLAHGYTFETFKADLAHWDISAFHDGSRAVGMLMKKGAELHVAVIPEVRGKWLSRRLIREVFAPILKEYGEAVTAVAPDNKVGLDFVRRIRDGFKTLEFDPTTALAASVGSSLLGGVIQGGAAESAASTQAQAAKDATNAQLQMFYTQNNQQAPWRQAGANALNDISAGFGRGPVSGAWSTTVGPMPTQSQFMTPGTGSFSLVSGEGPTLTAGQPGTVDVTGYNNALAAWNAAQTGSNAASTIPSGYFTHQFNANDLNANLAPNWKFSLNQGIGATKNAANLQTGLISGNTLKGIADYTLNKSGDLYQQAFNNYNANQSNIFNRLSTVAGLGSAANQQSAGLAGSLAPSIANSTMAAGTAAAGGTIGAANAISGGMNNALGWYQLNSFLNPSGGSVSSGIPVNSFGPPAESVNYGYVD